MPAGDVRTEKCGEHFKCAAKMIQITRQFCLGDGALVSHHSADEENRVLCISLIVITFVEVSQCCSRIFPVEWADSDIISWECRRESQGTQSASILFSVFSLPNLGQFPQNLLYSSLPLNTSVDSESLFELAGAPYGSWEHKELFLSLGLIPASDGSPLFAHSLSCHLSSCWLCPRSSALFRHVLCAVPSVSFSITTSAILQVSWPPDLPVFGGRCPIHSFPAWRLQPSLIKQALLSWSSSLLPLCIVAVLHKGLRLCCRHTSPFPSEAQMQQYESSWPGSCENQAWLTHWRAQQQFSAPRWKLPTTHFPKSDRKHKRNVIYTLQMSACLHFLATLRSIKSQI